MATILIQKIRELIQSEFPECQRMEISNDRYEWYWGGKLQFSIKEETGGLHKSYHINIVHDDDHRV